MKTIYSVRFAVKIKGAGDFISDAVTVLANGDALRAVEKVKRAQLRDKNIREFRLTSVEVLAEAEL